jgi:uncharacterized protein with FMN-binding domain
MGKGLVALSSAAIVSVYGIGYAITQPAAVSMAAGVAPSAPPVSAAMSSPADGAAAAPETGTAAAPAPTAQASAASTATSGLKDGTYTGTGWSRHGSVSVSVKVQGGRIVSAPITGVTTRYSQSVIAGLPAKVVAAQSSRVDLVSGATDSSDAYQSAVSQALSQAGGSAATAGASAATAGGSSGTTAPATISGSDGASTRSTSGPGVQVTGPGGRTIYRNGGGRRNSGGYGTFGD